MKKLALVIILGLANAGTTVALAGNPSERERTVCAGLRQQIETKSAPFFEWEHRAAVVDDALSHDIAASAALTVFKEHIAVARAELAAYDELEPLFRSLTQNGCEPASSVDAVIARIRSNRLNRKAVIASDQKQIDLILALQKSRPGSDPTITYKAGTCGTDPKARKCR